MLVKNIYINLIFIIANFIKQRCHNMTTGVDLVGFDEFGFSLNLNDLYPREKKKTVRKCSYCRIPDHDIRRCEAFMKSNLYCMFRECLTCSDKEKTTRFKCKCESCVDYRLFNCPNPTAAYHIREKHTRDRLPIVNLTNNTRSEIYIYSDGGSDARLEGTVDASVCYRLGEGETFEKSEFISYIVTNKFYGFKTERPIIEPESILKITELGYGDFNEIDITPRVFKEDKWKEAALKSLYLLEQLKRLGVGNNPNYEPIIDLVEDIEFPEYGEQDKELAGVTSTLTNVTVITGINEGE